MDRRAGRQDWPLRYVEPVEWGSLPPASARCDPARPGSDRTSTDPEAPLTAPFVVSDTGITPEKDMAIELRDDAANGVNEDGSTW